MSYDILVELLQRTTIGDINRSTIPFKKHVSQEDIQKAADNRMNPNIYFRKLISNPEKLLQSMNKNKVVLSGSRAAGYFNPYACTEVSDWDFYTVSNPVHILSFIQDLLSMNVEILSIHDMEQDRLELDYRHNIFIKYIITMKSTFKKCNKIQLMIVDGSTCMEAICDFDISIVQCIITGWCAISMYHDLTKNNKSISWVKSKINQNAVKIHMFEQSLRTTEVAHTTDDIINIHVNRTQESIKSLNSVNSCWLARLKKYNDRSISFLEYELYKNMTNNLSISAKEEIELRSIEDDSSLIIEFTTNEDSEIKIKNSKLKYYTWNESKFGTKFIATMNTSTHSPQFYNIEFKDTIDSLTNSISINIQESNMENKEKLNFKMFLDHIIEYPMISEYDF